MCRSRHACVVFEMHVLRHSLFGSLMHFGKLVQYSVKVFKQSLKSTDERIRLIGELMGSMDIVKCYAWEESLQSRVDAARNVELGWVQILSQMFRAPSSLSQSRFVASEENNN